MRWFLDMCIILYSAGEGDRPDLNKKTKKFIEEKGVNTFLTCYYIKERDLPKYLERQKIILDEIIKKINDDSYTLYNSQKSYKLTNRDKKKLIKLLLLSKTINKAEDRIKSIMNLFSELERRINSFLQNYIDEFVVPVGEIDQELRSHLMSFINIGKSNKNYSDTCILASAIQENNNKQLIIITADKNDWNKELLQEVYNHYNLKKKYPKLPDINYLQDL